MAIFVLCMNVLVAAFIFAFIAEIFTLLIGSLGLVLGALKRRVNNDP